MTRSSSLHRFAWLSAGCAFFLLFAGGMVTSTGSGLAVPDWPLAYGQYFPSMVGGVFFEHGHRMTAGVVGLMTVVLGIWVWLSEKRRIVRRLAAYAVGGIIAQALLGGMTVLFLLPKEISIAHACLGQAVFCVLLAIAELTASASERSLLPALGDALPAGAGVLAVAVIYLQLLLGAIFRHTGSGIAWHLVGALAVMHAVSKLCKKTFWESHVDSSLNRPAAILLVALPVQLILGGMSYLARLKPLGEAYWSALIPTAHLATGALMLGAALVWTMRAATAAGARPKQQSEARREGLSQPILS